MKALLLAGLLALAAIAGCMTSDDGREGTGSGGGAYDYGLAIRLTPPDDPMPEGADHDHAAVAQHKFLWNYAFSDRDALMQNAANVAGVHALDVQAGYLFGAVYGSHSAAIDGGLVIWDLADPAHPMQVGRWTIPGSVGGDRSMEATPDGDYAVIATEPADCAGHVNPFGGIGAYLIDTRDKALPVVSDVMFLNRLTVGDASNTASALLAGGGPNGPELGQHSVAVHRINGEDYAFIAGKIFHIQRGEQGARLVHMADVPTGHDMYLRDTPWNTTWAIAANGGGGMLIYDVTDPAHPFELAVWDLEGREELAQDYYFHTADVSFQPGQVVLVLSSEDWGETVSPLWVIDGNVLEGVTAPPKKPILLEQMGTWHNPGNHSALAGLTFSLHNPRFHDGGLLTLSSYHGGMWQLDVRHPDFWTEPAPIAYAAYAEGEPSVTNDPVESVVQQNLCGLAIQLDAPSYWDVEVGADGAVYLADGFMGLYTFTPTADHPVYGSAPKGTYFGTPGT
jgi:hypothetical protein